MWKLSGSLVSGFASISEKGSPQFWKGVGIPALRQSGRIVACCQSMRPVISFEDGLMRMLFGERSGWRRTGRERAWAWAWSGMCMSSAGASFK